MRRWKGFSRKRILLGVHNARIKQRERLIKLWKLGRLPTQQVATVSKDGVPLKWPDVEYYSERKATIHYQAVDPARLRNHIMRPRDYPPPPLVSPLVAKEMLHVYVQTACKDSRYRVNPNIVGNWPTVVGEIPKATTGWYHGFHPCSTKGVAEEGLLPRTCMRKCFFRRRFGPCLFLCGDFQNAFNWAQYVDIGFMLIEGQDQWVRYFCAAVAVIPDDEYEYDSIERQVIRPACICYDLRKESELRKLGRMISPHAGRFEVGAIR